VSIDVNEINAFLSCDVWYWRVHVTRMAHGGRAFVRQAFSASQANKLLSPIATKRQKAERLERPGHGRPGPSKFVALLTQVQAFIVIGPRMIWPPVSVACRVRAFHPLKRPYAISARTEIDLKPSSMTGHEPRSRRLCRRPDGPALEL
jgi:hypothetical protein